MSTMNEVQKFLRLPAVIEVTGRSRSTILRGAKDGSFPSPVHIGPRAIAWISAEVAEWQKKCIDASKGRLEVSGDAARGNVSP
ncbi:helix-turn-helix transcriptional regulator [Janthinobacterium sp. PSRC2-1]|jgi:prophage regulatory protein|uniref:helix-turn-helix transcriptional regulator n=2 Tax=Janthinobacterium TaxID=29580 RepID=UPI003CE75A62